MSFVVSHLAFFRAVDELCYEYFGAVFDELCCEHFGVDFDELCGWLFDGG